MQTVTKGQITYQVYGVAIGAKWFTAIYPVLEDGKLANAPIAIHKPSATKTHGMLVLHDSEKQAEVAGVNYVEQDYLKEPAPKKAPKKKPVAKAKKPASKKKK